MPQSSSRYIGDTRVLASNLGISRPLLQALNRLFPHLCTVGEDNLKDPIGHTRVRGFNGLVLTFPQIPLLVSLHLLDNWCLLGYNLFWGRIHLVDRGLRVACYRDWKYRDRGEVFQCICDRIRKNAADTADQPGSRIAFSVFTGSGPRRSQTVDPRWEATCTWSRRAPEARCKRVWGPRYTTRGWLDNLATTLRRLAAHGVIRVSGEYGRSMLTARRCFSWLSRLQVWGFHWCPLCSGV